MSKAEDPARVLDVHAGLTSGVLGQHGVLLAAVIRRPCRGVGLRKSRSSAILVDVLGST